MTTQTLTTENTTKLNSHAIAREAISLCALMAVSCLAFFGTGCSENSPMAPEAFSPDGLNSDSMEAASSDHDVQSACVGLIAYPVVPPMEGHPVTGWDANFVKYASGDGRILGEFKQGHGMSWIEESKQGTFDFVETNRDEWSIYLHDAARGIDVQLDLWVKRVILIGCGEWIVTDAGNSPVEPMDGNPVQGWDATDVQYSSSDRATFGRFRQVKGSNNWVDENSAGTFDFVEIGRDEWSVYLYDAARSTEVQLDLWIKKVIVIGSEGYIVTDAR